MYRVGVKGKFQARHFLVGDFGDETTPHSHEYTVNWSLKTVDLDENGFSLDIALLEETLEIVLRDLDERLLNDFAFFETRQPSVENTASFLHDSLFGILAEINAQGVTILLVEQNAVMALALAHRAYVLETGRVALEGASRDLAADHKVIRAYLGGAA